MRVTHRCPPPDQVIGERQWWKSDFFGIKHENPNPGATTTPVKTTRGTTRVTNRRSSPGIKIFN